ncbi:hypothetical protein ACFYYB_07875 [Streptomyces sp. NPDC002886]|uniref:hypothetical protein n=1 Tax=Streptomyces sp. NPDC002886 TaxID=3364667 RepID=UPI003696CD78
MTYLTTEQIAAAKENNLDAVTAVIAETETLVVQRSEHYATRGGHLDADLAEDLAQAGRIRVWESLSAFEGESFGEFMRYMDRALHSAMSEHRRQVLHPGVTATAAKDFERALALASGDPYEAVRMASTAEMGPRKMSPEHASAALLAWLGTDSFDRPLNDDMYGEAITLGDVIAGQCGIPVDLLDPSDYASARRKTIRDQVHRTLGLLGERQRHVLKADHGVSPVQDYGRYESDVELAEDMEATPKQIQEARSKGQKRFRELYQAGARTW